MSSGALPGLHEALAARELSGRDRLEKAVAQLDGQMRTDAALAADRLQAVRASCP